MARRSTVRACCAVAVVLVSAACTAGGGGPGPPGRDAAPASGAVRSSTPAGAGTGDEVLLTVTGAVGLVFGEHAFELGVDGDAEAVLVVSPEQAVTVRRGMTVRVTGVVEELRLAELRERGARLEERRLEGFEGRDALIAAIIEPAPPAGVDEGT